MLAEEDPAIKKTYQKTIEEHKQNIESLRQQQLL